MSSIYSGAACTLCAMSARAAADGFLGSSPEAVKAALDSYYVPSTARKEETTWHIGLRDADKDYAGVLEVRGDLSSSDLIDEPLLQRAWTYQEALLSPRLVMCFSEGRRPAFRCSVGTLRSDGGMVSAIPKSMMCLQDTMEGLRGTSWRYEVQEEWSTIVKQFSLRAVAFPTDRFPALMGVVTEWGRQMGTGTFQAGLWSESLLCDLMWRTPNGHTPRSAHESYIAPSWSWASRDHAVYYQQRGELWQDDEIARIIACDVTPLDPAVPSGALKSARLTVECIAEPVRLPDAETGKTGFWTQVETKDGSVTFMCDDYPEPQDLGEIWLLSLAMEEPYNNAHEVGLGVREVEDPRHDGAKLFVRVGLFDDMRRNGAPTGPKHRLLSSRVAQLVLEMGRAAICYDTIQASRSGVLGGHATTRSN